MGGETGGGLGQLCPHLRDLVQLPAQGSDLILQGLTILPHVRRAPSRCEDLKFPAGLPAGTCPYYKRRRAGPQGGRCPGRSAGKNFSSSKVGYGCNGSKNAVLCQHITGPRRRAGKDDPIAAEEKKHEGTGSAGGSVHGADSGARGPGGRDSGRDPARSHGGPLFGCAGGGVVRPLRGGPETGRGGERL